MGKPAAAAKPANETNTAPPAPASAPAPMTDAAAAIKQAMTDVRPPVRALLASEWKARESGVFFNTHEVVPPAGTPLSDLLYPEFFSNVSQKLKAGDTVLALPRDAAWYAELIVWDAGRNWAHVSVRFSQLRPPFQGAAGVDEEFEIRRDPIDGIKVVRRSTGTTLKSNFANHDDAAKWIRDHQRALRS